MTAHFAIDMALQELGYPHGPAPMKTKPDTYVSWFEVLAQTVLDASNKPRRIDHMIQVDVYSKGATEELTALVIRLLQDNGFKLASYGPEDYEEDTRYRHMPITVRYRTAINSEGGIINA